MINRRRIKIWQTKTAIEAAVAAKGFRTGKIRSASAASVIAHLRAMK
jgi:hypothetical protein